MPHIPQNPRMDSAEVRPIRGFFTMHDRCTAPIENGGGPAERQFAAAPRGGLHSVCRRRRTESETHVPFFRRRTTRRPAPSAATGRRSAENADYCYSFGGRLWKTLKQTSTYSPRRNDVENHIPCHTARAAPQSGICAWLFRVNFPDFPPAKTTRDSGLCLQRYEKIGMLLIFSLRKRRS